MKRPTRTNSGALQLDAAFPFAHPGASAHPSSSERESCVEPQHSIFESEVEPAQSIYGALWLAAALTSRQRSVHQVASGLKNPWQIAGTVKNAGYLNAGVGGKIEDVVIANPIAAQINGEFRAQPPALWVRGQPGALTPEFVDELVGGSRVVAGNVEPDLGKIGFRQFGDVSLFQRPEERLARCSAARSLRPRALMRAAVDSSNGTTLPARIWSVPARSCWSRRKPSATASTGEAYAPDFINWFKARLGAGGNSTVMQGIIPVGAANASRLRSSAGGASRFKRFQN